MMRLIHGTHHVATQVSITPNGLKFLSSNTIQDGFFSWDSLKRFKSWLIYLSMMRGVCFFFLEQRGGGTKEEHGLTH